MWKRAWNFSSYFAQAESREISPATKLEAASIGGNAVFNRCYHNGLHAPFGTSGRGMTKAFIKWSK